MRTIICTTGTSIAGGPNRRASLDEYRQSLRLRVSQMRASTEDTRQFLTGISAETNSLGAMHVGSDEHVVLLHTDTPDGQICAEEVSQLCAEEFRLKTTLRRIAGLQVRDATQFRREGILNLFKAVDEFCRPFLDQHPPPLALNVTGGFKSVVPYLTLYGLMYGVPVAYIFEQSNALITLPPAPVTFDFERLSQARDALVRLSRDQVMKRDAFFALIPGLAYHDRPYFETLIEEDDDLVAPSAFGQLLFAAVETDVCGVVVSPSAGEAYARSRGDVREQFTFMLERVPDPLWRRSKIHAVASTDLTVFKTGNTSERMLAFMRGRRIHVCELVQHAEYEKLIGTRNISNYEGEEFIPWVRPADTAPSPLSESEMMDSLRRKLSEAEKCWEATEQLVTDKKDENQELHTRLVTLDETAAADQAVIKALKSQIAEQDRELAWRRMPWWRRWLCPLPRTRRPEAPGDGAHGV